MRPVDRTLIDALPKAPPRFLITGLDPDGALWLAASAQHPSSRAIWFHYDLFAAGLARFQGVDPLDQIS